MVSLTVIKEEMDGLKAISALIKEFCGPHLLSGKHLTPRDTNNVVICCKTRFGLVKKHAQYDQKFRELIVMYIYLCIVSGRAK